MTDFAGWPGGLAAACPAAARARTTTQTDKHARDKERKKDHGDVGTQEAIAPILVCHGG